jgi:hypothetical protein
VWIGSVDPLSQAMCTFRNGGEADPEVVGAGVEPRETPAS